MVSNVDLASLKSKIKGELFVDNLHKIIYATDASVYRELPLGVIYPKDEEDVVIIVSHCFKNEIPIIPRSGGTSLAGQCVGNGLVMDVSKYMNKLVSIDQERKTTTVQPGIIRDELNHHLRPFGLMVGPNTSTANRATIGGMVGNNSCGSTSIVFGSMRDHIKGMKVVLSNGKRHEFTEESKEIFSWGRNERSIIGSIYSQLEDSLIKEEVQQLIQDKFPKKSIKRRNTGYALDALVDSEVFSSSDKSFNLCKLLCGSEGTLAITTELTVGLVDIPPPIEVLLAIHFDSIEDSMEAVPYIMNHSPFACELMDKTILDCTKGQLLYEKDRFFINGDPKAVMLVSFVGEGMDETRGKVKCLVDELKLEGYGYDFPIITEKIDRVWNLRKAGLGLLANLPGDDKAVACIEDTAVAIEDLSSYIAEFTKLMNRYGQESVYYAHAGAGELHLRPILDLKKSEDRQLFYDISLETARLVKKYRGSLSGEHGDGRVRAPFIEELYGKEIYRLFVDLKKTWDHKNILNPGKIVVPKDIREDLRYDKDHEEKTMDTIFDFSIYGGIIRAAEKCNGSGDCRKLTLSGGTMCPSYMATRDEKSTTRARANTLREVLTRPKTKNAWDSSELKEVLDLCLSCKGCTSECPSNVDMSTMKAEFTYQYNKLNGVPLRSKIFARFSTIGLLGSKYSNLTNYLINNKRTSGLLKSLMGIHKDRSLPKINKITLRKRYIALSKTNPEDPIKIVYLFCDEFTNYNDASIGEMAIRLLQELGYTVLMVDHEDSGRAAFSKGMLDLAKKYANNNVERFSKIVDINSPLIGIEPSAILSFRDEYPKIVDKKLVKKAQNLSRLTFTVEEFLYAEAKKGNITDAQFSNKAEKILLHGHCHQKALTDLNEVAWLLSLPQNYNVEIIPSGCCGMAGSFGYEKEHYEVSMKIGELVLFPAVRKSKPDSLVVASGTSCRHQILDGTNRKAIHVVEALWSAINEKR